MEQHRYDNDGTVPYFGGRAVQRRAYQGGALGRPIGGHAEYGPREAVVESQLRWGLDYIDRTYGTRWSRAKRHLRRAWTELRAALAEYR